MTDDLIPIPEGAEESFVVREAVERVNRVRAQQTYERNRRLEELLRAAGIDPEGEPPIELRGEAA